MPAKYSMHMLAIANIIIAGLPTIDFKVSLPVSLTDFTHFSRSHSGQAQGFALISCKYKCMVILEACCSVSLTMQTGSDLVLLI